MKVQIEVEVPDYCDIREEMGEIQQTVQEAVNALFDDGWEDEGDDRPIEDVVDGQGRL